MKEIAETYSYLYGKYKHVYTQSISLGQNATQGKSFSVEQLVGIQSFFFYTGYHTKAKEDTVCSTTKIS